MFQWFSSSDNEGKLYFFEKNSNESTWVLPETTPQIVNEVRKQKYKNWATTSIANYDVCHNYINFIV